MLRTGATAGPVLPICTMCLRHAAVAHVVEVIDSWTTRQELCRSCLILRVTLWERFAIDAYVSTTERQ